MPTPPLPTLSPTPASGAASAPIRPAGARTRRSAGQRGAQAGDNPEKSCTVRVLQTLDTLFSRIFHHTEVLSPNRLPRKGPAILVCNHISGLDPLLLQSACPRLVIWMMAKEYYDMRALAPVYRAVHAIPVDRTGRDLSATRAAMRALQAGHILGVFPEGRIETSRELLPFQTGVALMAIKSNVPVFPTYLEGTQRGMEMLEAILQPQQARLMFGPEVKINRSSTSRESLNAATALIKQAVADLSRQTPQFRFTRHK